MASNGSTASSGAPGKPNGKFHTPHSPTDPDHDDFNSKYDPADFIIQASDAKGHSERVWCRMQPGHDRQLDVILRSRKFPFRTKGDIIRWAVVRGLRILEQMEEVPSIMKQVDMMMDVLADEQIHHEHMVVFEKTRERVAAYIGSNSIGQARRLVSILKMRADGIPDDYWRGLYLERLEKEFGYLLESNNGTGGGTGAAKGSRLGRSMPVADPSELDDVNVEDENETE